MTQQKLNNKGFTLTELLVVIFIISVLAAILIINLTKVRMKARDNRRKVDIADIANAVELYYSQNHSLPANVNNEFIDVNLLNKLKEQYLPKPPFDPLVSSGSGSTGYMYYQNSSGHYCVFTYLENIGQSDNVNIGDALCTSQAWPNNCNGETCNYYIDK